MMVGQILRRLALSADDSLVLDLVPDLVLLARAREAAESGGRSLSGYVAAACRGFIDSASEDEWTTLIGRFQNGAEPGASFVEAALRRSLDAGGCGCGAVHGRAREPVAPVERRPREA